MVVELALNAYGKVGVSLYDTLGDEAVGAFASLNGRTHLELTSISLRVYVRSMPTTKL